MIVYITLLIKPLKIKINHIQKGINIKKPLQLVRVFNFTQLTKLVYNVCN
jgi:hypothetical protein